MTALARISNFVWGRFTLFLYEPGSVAVIRKGLEKSSIRLFCQEFRHCGEKREICFGFAGQSESVRIEEKVINLTVAQAIKSVELCQKLSDLYRDIYLFRFSPVWNNLHPRPREYRNCHHPKWNLGVCQ
ncbi:DUF6888 family protein [Leptolyngbya sp. NIES-2104]|uniref:DUF6888 family protein n=1 Tax=Leptolyngbya sp. NIES-2104 TaxID=1552121 RepID=UPI00403FC9ED